jgi:hypothetical protein
LQQSTNRLFEPLIGPEFGVLRQIISNRRYKTQPYWQIVHEWEDVLSEELDLRLVSPGKSLPERLLSAVSANPILRQVGMCLRGRSRHPARALVFHMTPRERVPLGEVPIIIDFWKSKYPGDVFSAYKHCPLVYLSSLEATRHLQADGCPINIRYLAPSLPDIHRPAGMSEKTFDIIQAGRDNSVLNDYMSRLLAERADIEYVTRQSVSGRLHYVSNKRGDLGIFESRQQYFDLLRKSRVALYASPGVDEGLQQTGGFSPITPRLLEMVASHCLVAARYVSNADSEYFALEEVCPTIGGYSQFKALVCDYLYRGDSHPAYSKYPAFLDRHYTSRRARQIAADFGDLQFTI